MDEELQLLDEELEETGGFVMVPNYLARLGVLNNDEFRLWVVLRSYAWGKPTCYPSQARIAEDLGVSVNTVSRWLDGLKRLGFVMVGREGMPAHNVYRIRKLTSIPAIQERLKEKPEQKQEEPVTHVQETAKNIENPLLALRLGYDDNDPTPEGSKRGGADKTKLSDQNSYKLKKLAKRYRDFTARDLVLYWSEAYKEATGQTYPIDWAGETAMMAAVAQEAGGPENAVKLIDTLMEHRSDVDYLSIRFLRSKAGMKFVGQFLYRGDERAGVVEEDEATVRSRKERARRLLG